MAVLVLLAYGLWQVLISPFLGTESTISRTASTDGRYTALIIRREGNATVSTTYVVRIVPSDSRWKQKEVVSIDRVGEPDQLKVKWVGNRLEVTLPLKSQVFGRVSQAHFGDHTVSVSFLDTPAR